MRNVPSASPRVARPVKHLIALLVVSAMLIAALPAAGAQPAAAADPAVITTWNAIAVSTITGPVLTGGAGKANAEAFLWFAFVHAAIYNAVVGITGEYELYKGNAEAPPGASPEAAAAAAAHRVLMEYFGNNPLTVSNLDASLAASLGQIPDGVAKELGIRFGERAADRIIRLRTDDGRFAPVVFDPPLPLQPGVWRPTPPAFAPFFDPWLGQVDPLVLDSLDQFDPGPPPAIDSDLYVKEFEEVRDYGAKSGSLRTPHQTEIALFFSDIPFAPIQAALRDLVTRRQLDISESARLFAAVDLSLADTVGAVWNGKLAYAWWRPITAIQLADDDGNPDTVGVPEWEPLITTPPYPEWPSGLAGVIGALSTTLSRLNSDGTVDLTITSAAAGVTRHFDDPAQIQRAVVNARVWSGIHFHTSDVVGLEIGVQVGNWTLDHYFAPTS